VIYHSFRTPQALLLNEILKGEKHSKALLPHPHSSILKGTPIVNPHELQHFDKQDFSTFKSMVLLMGLPIQDIDEYISKVWGLFKCIQNENHSVHCRILLTLFFNLKLSFIKTKTPETLKAERDFSETTDDIV
jgi:hypothetical protein